MSSCPFLSVPLSLFKFAGAHRPPSPERALRHPSPARTGSSPHTSLRTQQPAGRTKVVLVVKTNIPPLHPQNPEPLLSRGGWVGAKELVLFCVAASHPSRFPAAVCSSSQSFNELSLVSFHRHMFASHCLLFVTPPLICLLLYLGPVALGITSWQVTSNCPASKQSGMTASSESGTRRQV